MVARDTVLDRIDFKILRLLQQDGRMPNVELARRINLSPAPCLARVKKLEREGFIRGYQAQLDPDRLGLSLLAFVEVTLNRTTPDVFDKFRDAIRLVPEVEECHMVAGGFDYLVKVRCANMAAYRRILGEKLSVITGVMQTHTYVVMEEVKTAAPLSV
jgi:Lrp/AsnC family leucine-responsive transcriptional regulator